MSVKDGGPAFPWAIGIHPPAPGMSLRAYFAGQALEGMLHTLPFSVSPETCAAKSVQMADALLAALAEGAKEA